MADAAQWGRIADIYTRFPQRGFFSSGIGFFVGLAVSALFVPGSIVSLAVPLIGTEPILWLVPCISWAFTVSVLWYIPSSYRKWQYAKRFDLHVREALGARGARFLTPKDTVRWLQQHWRGRYPSYGFISSPRVITAALSPRGIPVLCSVTADGVRISSGENYNFLEWCWLCAPRSGAIDAAPDAELSRQLAALGYEVTVEGNGLFVWAEIEKKRNSPEAETSRLLAAAECLAAQASNTPR